MAIGSINTTVYAWDGIYFDRVSCWAFRTGLSRIRQQTRGDLIISMDLE